MNIRGRARFVCLCRHCHRALAERRTESAPLGPGLLYPRAYRLFRGDNSGRPKHFFQSMMNASLNSARSNSALGRVGALEISFEILLLQFRIFCREEITPRVEIFTRAL